MTNTIQAISERNDLKSGLESTKEDIRGTGQTGQTAQTAKAELQHKTEEMKRTAQNLGHTISENVQDKVKNLRQGASNYYNRSKDKARDMEQSVEERIHRRPLASVMLAAVGGLVLGKLMERKRAR